MVDSAKVKIILVLTIFSIVIYPQNLNFTSNQMEYPNFENQLNDGPLIQGECLNEHYNIMIAGSSHSYCNYIEKSPTKLLNFTSFNYSGHSVSFSTFNFASGGALASTFITEIAPSVNLSFYDFIVLEYSTRATIDTLETFETQMTQIVNMILDAGSIPVIQTSVYFDFPNHYSWDRNSALEPYNQFLIELANNYQIPLVDVTARFKKEIEAGNWDLFIRNDEYPQNDINYYSNSHPNELGQYYIFEEIINAITQYLFAGTDYISILKKSIDIPSINPIYPVIKDPITINGNSDWINYYEILNIKGEGSDINPYIISDIIFQTGPDSTALTINNSSQYFLIQNCTFISESKFNNTIGLKISNTNNGQVDNSSFRFFRNGLLITNASNIKFFSNDFSWNLEFANQIVSSEFIQIGYNNYTDNLNAIRVYFTTSSNISFNNFIRNRYSALDLTYCNNSIIENNCMQNNSYGINQYEGIECNFSSNLFQFNVYGIVISNINRTNLYRNCFVDNSWFGIYFWNYQKISQENLISNNYFYKNNVGLGISYLPFQNWIIYNFLIENRINAYCISPQVSFDNGSIGNFYSDIEYYQDKNEDGINDYSHSVPPDGACVDNFPLYLTVSQINDILQKIFSWKGIINIYSNDTDIDNYNDRIKKIFGYEPHLFLELSIIGILLIIRTKSKFRAIKT